MSTNWLAAISFQQGQDILHSINTLSIHTKLRLRGISDDERIEKANDAKNHLTKFLKNLDSLVKEIQKNKDGPITGINPRLSRLACDFISSAQKEKRFRELFSRSLEDVIRLINSDDEENQKTLLRCLAELRLLVEQHMHSDANQILGKF